MMPPEYLFRRRGKWPLISQQIVTLAFGAKHIPFGMLFIANDFGVPVIYIGWVCWVNSYFNFMLVWKSHCAAMTAGFVSRAW